MELVGIGIFIVGLIFSIALHEMGHMIPAKRFGAMVPEFMVGFGPILWSREVGSTKYGFRAIPLGGFVRILGMYPPASNDRVDVGPFAAAVSAARIASAREVEENKAKAFWQLSGSKRIIVMLGGPLMNLFLGVILATIAISGIGIESATTRLESVKICSTTSCSVKEEGPAALSGVVKGDQLVRIDKFEIKEWEDVTAALSTLKYKDIVTVHVIRSGVLLEKKVELGVNPNGSGAFLGVGPETELRRAEAKELGKILSSFIGATLMGVASFPTRVIEIFGGALGENRGPSSPVGVIGVARIGGEFTASGESAAEVTVSILLLLAGLNLSLFAFNLIPLLPLDGGHVAGVMYEVVRNRIRSIRGVNTQPVDVARMLPITYGIALLLISLSLLLAFSDLVNPVKL
jgi:membrane-associated protease RseP (regulator of RpoE activity)